MTLLASLESQKKQLVRQLSVLEAQIAQLKSVEDVRQTGVAKTEPEESIEKEWLTFENNMNESEEPCFATGNTCSMCGDPMGWASQMCGRCARYM